MSKKLLNVHLPFCFESMVLHGKKRGRLLGFRTANLNPRTCMNTKREKITIPNGFSGAVLFGWAKIEGEDIVHKSIVSIGINPTFDDDDNLKVEAHLREEFDEEFYGKNLKLLICGKIRGQKKFNSVEELKTQMNHDVLEGEKYLNYKKYKKYIESPFFSNNINEK